MQDGGGKIEGTEQRKDLFQQEKEKIRRKAKYLVRSPHRRKSRIEGETDRGNLYSGKGRMIEN